MKSKKILLKIKQLKQRIINVIPEDYTPENVIPEKTLKKYYDLFVKHTDGGFVTYKEINKAKTEKEFFYLFGKRLDQEEKIKQIMKNVCLLEKEDFDKMQDVGVKVLKKKAENIAIKQSNENKADTSFSWFQSKYHQLVNKFFKIRDRIMNTVFKGGYSNVGNNLIELIKRTSKEAYAIYKEKGVIEALRHLFTEDLFDVFLIVSSIIFFLLGLYLVYKLLSFIYAKIKDKLSKNKELDTKIEEISKISKRMVNSIISVDTLKSGIKLFFKLLLKLLLKVFKLVLLLLEYMIIDFIFRVVFSPLILSGIIIYLLIYYNFLAK